MDAMRATWKLGKEVTSTQKFILMALAERAGENDECWPSLKRICFDTNYDIKTIVFNRQQLIDKGLIEYTGELKGRTHSVKVMRLCYVEQRYTSDPKDEQFATNKKLSTSLTTYGNASNLSIPNNGYGSIPENGYAKHTQKRVLEPNRSFEPKKEPKRIAAIADFFSKTLFEKHYLSVPNSRTVEELNFAAQNLLELKKATSGRHAVNMVMKTYKNDPEGWKTPYGFSCSTIDREKMIVEEHDKFATIHPSIISETAKENLSILKNIFKQAPHAIQKNPKVTYPITNPVVSLPSISLAQWKNQTPTSVIGDSMSS